MTVIEPDQFIHTIRTLNEANVPQRIIKEDGWEWISNSLGIGGWETLKEKIFGVILRKLGLGAEMNKFLSITFANLSFSEFISMFKSCANIANVIMDGLVEYYSRGWLAKKLGSGIFSDILINGIYASLQDPQSRIGMLAQINKMLVPPICKILTGTDNPNDRISLSAIGGGAIKGDMGSKMKDALKSNVAKLSVAKESVDGKEPLNEYHVTLKCSTLDYDCLLDFLNGRSKRVLANNSMVEKNGDEIAITHHYTDIITIGPTNIATINNGGHYSPSTKDRLNQLLSRRGVGIRTVKGDWIVMGKNGSLPYYRNMKIDEDGNILDEVK